MEGKTNERVVNKYINPEQLPIDAKVAGILCVGGPVKYQLKANSHATKAWIRRHVVPGITATFSDGELKLVDCFFCFFLIY